MGRHPDHHALAVASGSVQAQVQGIQFDDDSPDWVDIEDLDEVEMAQLEAIVRTIEGDGEIPTISVTERDTMQANILSKRCEVSFIIILNRWLYTDHSSGTSSSF